MQEQCLAKFNELTDNLQQIIKVYRSLLDNLRHEKDILIEADLTDLNENNKSKEKILVRASELERERIELVKQYAQLANIKMKEPKLLELATNMKFEFGDRLRNLHSALVLLLKRVKETNEQNEILVRSALENVTGAMNSIKDSVAEKPTYAPEGKIKEGASKSGRLVSREA